MKTDVVLPASEEVQPATNKLSSKTFGQVMETQIAAVDREKQRALEQKAKDVANKD